MKVVGAETPVVSKNTSCQCKRLFALRTINLYTVKLLYAIKWKSSPNKSLSLMNLKSFLQKDRVIPKDICLLLLRDFVLAPPIIYDLLWECSQKGSLQTGNCISVEKFLLPGMNTLMYHQHSSCHLHCQTLHNSWVLRKGWQVVFLQRTHNHLQRPRNQITISTY